VNEQDLNAVLWTQEEIRERNFSHLNDGDWNPKCVLGSTLWIVCNKRGELLPAPQPRPFFPSA